MELLYAFGAAYAASVLYFLILLWRAPSFDDDERPILSAGANESELTDIVRRLRWRGSRKESIASG